MHAFACGLAAIAAGMLVARPAAAEPSYIEAKPDALAAAYGDDVVKRAFSDELTQTRTSFIKDSLPPDAGCGDQPDFTLREAYPYQIDPSDVMWIERYEVACKQDLRRALLVMLKDGKFKPLALLPGATAADPNLQVDASNIVTTAAMTRLKKPCDQIGISDTAVTEMPPPAGGPWKELWTVLACAQTFKIGVSFAPSSGGGTDISVLASE